MNKTTAVQVFAWTSEKQLTYTQCTPGNHKLNYRGQYMLRARAVWIAKMGHPGNLNVVHKCGNADCIKFEHLRLQKQGRGRKWLHIIPPHTTEFNPA